MKALIVTCSLLIVFPVFLASAQNDFQAAEQTRKMKNKLHLTPSQEIVVAIANGRYAEGLEALVDRNLSDSAAIAERRRLKKKWAQSLETVLSESQYESWMRFVYKAQRKKS
ncbi:MAG: hypothetical protein RIF36_04160 [Imperialibacter sp.]|uniref:hypothetical protein n=1 Tax=Imperialibacter sp. TaxID=2038411 RepID=UPI0032EC411A